jgi:phenylacetate-CoA ligase
VAAGRGLYLGWWRYGRDSESLVAAALAADTQAAAARDDERAEALARVLHRAATKVPYYRSQWDARRRAGDRAGVDDLASWPILDKASVKADPRAFVADDMRPERMFADHTSGTTGTPLTVWLSRRTARRWYALFEARTRRWQGVSRHDRWAILGGQPVVRADQRRPPYWVWNPALHQLYLSTYHLSAATAPDYADALRSHRITHIVAYPSATAALAGWLGPGSDGAFPDLKVVFSNAETLTTHQRETIGGALGVPVRDTWGQSEIVSAGSECEHGTLHEWPEAGVTEIVDDDGHAAGHGRLVATSLLNADMPLVRYDTGDIAARPAETEPCACGRTLPRIGPIEGRSDDVIVTPDGRHVGRLDPVFKADLPILEAQVMQDTPTTIKVLVVPLPGFSAAHEATIAAGLRDRVGQMDIRFEHVGQVPRGANGKFRAVVSRVGQGGGVEQP